MASNGNVNDIELFYLAANVVVPTNCYCVQRS